MWGSVHPMATEAAGGAAHACCLLLPRSLARRLLAWCRLARLRLNEAASRPVDQRPHCSPCVRMYADDELEGSCLCLGSEARSARVQKTEKVGDGLSLGEGARSARARCRGVMMLQRATPGQ